MNLKTNEVLEALNQNNLSSAITKIHELEKAEPENFELKVLYGDIFSRMSNFQMAYEKYDAAMRINPASPEVYAKLGVTNGHLQLWPEAANHFKAALDFEPENSAYQGYYGWALWNVGQEKDNQTTKEKAYAYLSNAKRDGVEAALVNHALAEYHLDRVTSTWPVVESENGTMVVATKRDHLVSARKQLEVSSTYIGSEDEDLIAKYHDSKNRLAELEKREFHGYPFVRNAGIIAGIILLLAGQILLGVASLVLAGLYVHSNMCPGYIANRKLLKGDTRDPFWVRRIDEIGRLAGNITVFSQSITRVIFLSWLIGFVARITQYGVALVLLPILVLAGYISNYDLVGKTKRLFVR